MPFTLKDTYRCLAVLGLAPDSVATVAQRLEALEQQSEYLVDQVLLTLQSLETAEQALLAETGSANFAILQASVLQYAENKRVAGILLQHYLFSKRLGISLSLKPNLEILEGMLRMLGLNLPHATAYMGRIERS